MSDCAPSTIYFCIVDLSIELLRNYVVQASLGVQLVVTFLISSPS